MDTVGSLLKELRGIADIEDPEIRKSAMNQFVSSRIGIVALPYKLYTGVPQTGSLREEAIRQTRYHLASRIKDNPGLFFTGEEIKEGDYSTGLLCAAVLIADSVSHRKHCLGNGFAGAGVVEL